MRLRYVLGLALLSLILVVSRLPATLADMPLQRLGLGLRLAEAEGTLWSGRGWLASRAEDGRSYTYWQLLSWRFAPGAILHGKLAWTLSGPGLPEAELAVSPKGVQIAGLRMPIPAAAAFSLIDHPLAHAGWRGDLRLDVAAWQCDFHSACSGQLRLDWVSATSELLPGPSLGDYSLQVRSQGDQMDVALSTSRPERVAISGNGHLAKGSRPQFKGVVSGEPALLQRLPNVAGQYVQPTGEPGRVMINVN